MRRLAVALLILLVTGTDASVAAQTRALGDTQNTAALHAARLFYMGWDTGRTSYFSDAVAPSFHDNTLPPGRPQGPRGLIFASNAFRKSVPDLHCQVHAYLVAGDYVTARMTFTGTSVTGKPVAFRAVDILHVVSGKIVEDWHLEDMLTLEKELGSAR